MDLNAKVVQKHLHQRLRQFINYCAPAANAAVNIAAALVLLWCVTQQFVLDIHISEPHRSVWVELTVSDQHSASTYSFCLLPRAEARNIEDTI